MKVNPARTRRLNIEYHSLALCRGYLGARKIKRLKQTFLKISVVPGMSRTERLNWMYGAVEFTGVRGLTPCRALVRAYIRGYL